MNPNALIQPVADGYGGFYCGDMTPVNYTDSATGTEGNFVYQFGLAVNDTLHFFAQPDARLHVTLELNAVRGVGAVFGTTVRSTFSVRLFNADGDEVEVPDDWSYDETGGTAVTKSLDLELSGEDAGIGWVAAPCPYRIEIRFAAFLFPAQEHLYGSVTITANWEPACPGPRA